jgi:hypothetical protein
MEYQRTVGGPAAVEALRNNRRMLMSAGRLWLILSLAAAVVLLIPMIFIFALMPVSTGIKVIIGVVLLAFYGLLMFGLITVLRWLRNRATGQLDAMIARQQAYHNIVFQGEPAPPSVTAE